jgi:hypothetical protein
MGCRWHCFILKRQYAKSSHELMIQSFAGVHCLSNTGFYCYGERRPRVGSNRVRQLRNKILNETRSAESHVADVEQQDDSLTDNSYATGHY